MRISKSTKINKLVCQFFVAFILIIIMVQTGDCFAMREKEDSISNLSFSHDGKSVVFDRCREGDCGIQIYNLETGELAAYQSPHNEQWTMGKYSYDGKKITFSVIPIKPNDDFDLGNMQIAVMDADGKNYKKVTTGQGAKLYPTFSHNGKKILYACAARIRESGRTPAANYDAWEVDLTTGKQTRLTFFEYFYMGYLTYFPDDERFIYFGEAPSLFEGVKLFSDKGAFLEKMTELEQKGKSLYNVVVMKGKELLPNPYNFPPKTFAQTPLLSKDGSVMIYEKSELGKFYLNSENGNHRLVGEGGSVNSAAISPDGKLLAFIAVSQTMDISTVQDGKTKLSLYLPRTPEKIKNWPKDLKQEEIRLGYKFRMIPEKPSHILNQSSIKTR